MHFCPRSSLPQDDSQAALAASLLARVKRALRARGLPVTELPLNLLPGLVADVCGIQVSASDVDTIKSAFAHDTGWQLVVPAAALVDAADAPAAALVDAADALVGAPDPPLLYESCSKAELVSLLQQRDRHIVSLAGTGRRLRDNRAYWHEQAALGINIFINI